MEACKPTPKYFELLKIAENRGKIRENLSKIYENFCKIPENLGKLLESTGKNGTQRCMILTNWRSICAQSHEDLFWSSSQKKVCMICVGGNISTKSYL